MEKKCIYCGCDLYKDLCTNPNYCEAFTIYQEVDNLHKEIEELKKRNQQLKNIAKDKKIIKLEKEIVKLMCENANLKDRLTELGEDADLIAKQGS